MNNAEKLLAFTNLMTFFHAALDADEREVYHAQDPDRAEREVAARRRRLERHHPVFADNMDWMPCASCGRFAWPCPDLRDDLSAYAGWPGYREEWRP